MEIMSRHLRPGVPEPLCDPTVGVSPPGMEVSSGLVTVAVGRLEPAVFSLVVHSFRFNKREIF